MAGAGKTYQSGVSIPGNPLIANNQEYTGTLVPRTENNSLVPGGATPNVQTAWLERTLAEGRDDPSVDMIVVFQHQMVVVEGSDLALRQAWAPLYDWYQVDLVLQGHAHEYERSYPVRGYNPPAGTVATAFGSYAVGDTIDTRRPTVTVTQPATVNATSAWNTSEGTCTWCMLARTFAFGGIARATAVQDEREQPDNRAL